MNCRDRLRDFFFDWSSLSVMLKVNESLYATELFISKPLHTIHWWNWFPFTFRCNYVRLFFVRKRFRKIYEYFFYESQWTIAENQRVLCCFSCNKWTRFIAWLCENYALYQIFKLNNFVAFGCDGRSKKN